MYTEIDIRKIQNAIREMDDSERKLRREYQELVELNFRMRYLDTKSMDEVRRKLGRQIEGLEREIAKVQKLRAAIKRIIHMYEECEHRVLEQAERKPKFQLHAICDFRPWNFILGENQILFK